MMKRTSVVLLAMATVACLFMIGCGDDDDCVNEPSQCVEADRDGSINIDMEPDVIHASWQMTGPDGYLVAGTGDLSLTDLFPGNYSLSLGDVPSYDPPNPSIFTQYLGEGDTITFAAQYDYSGPARWVPVLIPPISVSMPTTFTMGDLVESDETPHQVTLTGRFEMAATEVSNAQYIMALQWAYDTGLVTVLEESSVFDTLDGSNERLVNLSGDPNFLGFHDGVFSCQEPDHPVLDITWYGAAAYCDWLSLMSDLPRAYDHSTWQCNNGNPYASSSYRLPTEAEWELACRGGTTGPFNTGDCIHSYYEANFIGSIPYLDCPTTPVHGHLTDVGSLSASDWGLYDMHGNVWEWCNDWYGSYSGDETNPVGDNLSEERVLRGGGRDDVPTDCRSARRENDNPRYTGFYRGFRPVKSVD